jgi:hypothetical protein
MDFIGRTALMKQRDEGVMRMYVQLIVQEHDHEVDLWPWGTEPIYRNGRYVGSITTTGYGFTFQKQVGSCSVLLSCISNACNKICKLCCIWMIVDCCHSLNPFSHGFANMASWKVPLFPYLWGRKVFCSVRPIRAGPSPVSCWLCSWNSWKQT